MMNLTCNAGEEQVAKINRNIIRLGELMLKLHKEQQLPKQFSKCLGIYENIGYGLDELENNCKEKMGMIREKMSHCLCDFQKLDLPQEQLLGEFNKKLMVSILNETIMLIEVYTNGEREIAIMGF